MKNKTSILLLFVTVYFQVAFSNPVLRGDNPDPSIVKIHDSLYYATSTTNEWAPIFPIFKSVDLLNWKIVNFVFPNGSSDTKDGWAKKHFWAAELSYDKEQQKLFAYYTAIPEEGKLRCGVASLDLDLIETGNFIDHGPVIVDDENCGTIDAFELQIGNKYYVLWKNDGNACEVDSHIWAQEINKERTQLLREKQIVLSQSQNWEKSLIEGACFFYYDQYIYAIYSAGACCDGAYDYATGIARVRKDDFFKKEKWEKYAHNPIISSDDEWRAPGHGTVVIDNGHVYFLYHAYADKTDYSVGREGVLVELKQTKDGWFTVDKPAKYRTPLNGFSDSFDDDKLNFNWQWFVTEPKPQYNISPQGLILYASDQNNGLGSFLGTRILSGNFQIITEVKPPINAQGGILLAGSFAGATWPMELGGIGLSLSSSELSVFSSLSSRNSHEVLKSLKGNFDEDYSLKIEVKDNCKNLSFFYKKKRDKNWLHFYSTEFDMKKYLPWGMGYRAGIFSKGKLPNSLVFRSFELKQ